MMVVTYNQEMPHHIMCDGSTYDRMQGVDAGKHSFHLCPLVHIPIPLVANDINSKFDISAETEKVVRDGGP